MAGGTAPILIDDPSAVYSNPLPHVLILTAIVVGVATTALGLALVLRINEAFGSIEEDVLLAAKTEAALERPNRRRTAIKDSKQNDS
jgi:multicomponent Na+:H+ antiporter subunit C